MRPRNFFKRHFGTATVRRRAWHRFLDRKADEHGLHVYRSHLMWQLPGEFQDVADAWGDVPGLPLDRCFFIWSVGRYLRARGIAGATADCGVRFGKSTHFLLRGLGEPDRPHHLFDSFEGLSTPHERDRVTSPFAGQWEKGDLAVPEEVARRHLRAFSNCVFHKGWIPDTFGELRPEDRYAFVHVDVDLYEPTRACYEYFYDRLVPGGMILCDDYGLASCPGATQAVNEFVASRGEALLEVPTSQSLLIKR